MSNSFSSQIFAEKLSKLSNTQQSIETLSHWCVEHRKKAKHIVESWEKLFSSSSIEQRVSFLYLANDILQNSRRKGSEFVNEFWKVLPGALKSVCEDGDDRGKSTVMRLVGIWDERKVFGSRGRGLKDEFLGTTPPFRLLADNSGKSSNAIKVVRKDAHTIRIKLTVGGMAEKIVTLYQPVLDGHLNEDTALEKCKATVSYVGKMEKDVDYACTEGIQQGSTLMNEVEEQETILKQCMEQLGSSQTTRAVLIAQLKEALQEQESKMDLIRTQLQVAKSETERTISMKQRLVSATSSAAPGPSSNSTTRSLPAETKTVTEPNAAHQTTSITPPLPLQPRIPFNNYVRAPSPQPPQPPSGFANSSSSPPQPSLPVTYFPDSSTTSHLQPPLAMPLSTSGFRVPAPQPSQPVTSFANLSAEEQNKRAAAAMAAKLTASSSSAQMLSSVLSSLAAEEAASMNKRPKLEKPMSASDMNNAFFRNMLPPKMAPLPQVSAAGMQPVSQNDQQPPLPPPPLPPLPPPPMQQYVQSSGPLVGIMPYNFMGNVSQPPPPPLPPVPPPQQQQQQQQQFPPMSFFPPPGFGFYGPPPPQQFSAPAGPAPPGGSVAGQGSST